MTESDQFPTFGSRYLVRSLIAAGGMGQVYLADDLKHGRPVAIKRLDPEIARAVGVDRFLREVSIVARLVHPNIVPLYDSGEVAGDLYYVTPYIEGQSLRQMLRREGQLPLEQVLGWARELADALSYAHDAGFIHRDIKPENILLQAGHAMLVDFGIARAIDVAGGTSVTSGALAVGTPPYMSPEQSHGDAALDERSDMFSLACVIYELLAGEPPFTGPSPQAILAKKMAGDYPRLSTTRPTLPGRIERTLARALSVNPVDRFREMGAFTQALHRTERRRPPISLVAGSLLVAGGLLVALLGGPWRDAHPAIDRVVVAAFENQTGDPDLDSFGVMAADWVTDGLQRTGTVDVVPTASALSAVHFIRGQAGIDPVATIARETSARIVVTGALYRIGDTLFVRSQVIDAVTRNVLGSLEPIRTGRATPEALLGELRSRLMGLLALRRDDRVSPMGPRREQPPAYQAYKAFSEGLDRYVLNEFSKALPLFTLSYQLDTTFVLPLLYVALCFTNGGQFAEADSVLITAGTRRAQLSDHDRYWLDYSRAELRGSHQEALTAIRHAAELAPGSKADYNFALQAMQARRPFAAESALRRLSPDRGPMRGWLPYWLVLTDAQHAMGEHDAEIEAAQKAVAGFPDRFEAYGLLARALAALRRGSEALEVLVTGKKKTSASPTTVGDQALEVAQELRAHADTALVATLLALAAASYERAAGTTQTAFGLVRVALERADWLRVVEAVDRQRESGSRSVASQGLLGIALARAGLEKRARQILDSLEEDSSAFSFGFPQFEAARIAASLGDTARSLALLDVAYATGYPYNLGPHRDPALRSLWSHPHLRPLDAVSR